VSTAAQACCIVSTASTSCAPSPAAIVEAPHVLKAVALAEARHNTLCSLMKVSLPGARKRS
jgi:hypothetical protein